MNIDGLSSPPAPNSSLPPSSAPDPTGRSPRRPRADVLTFGDDEAQDDNENEEGGGRRRRRAKGQVIGDVTLVKDAVGESVAESFEAFLKTLVHTSFYSSWPD
jgi:DNA replication licensing factor MCM6